MFKLLVEVPAKSYIFQDFPLTDTLENVLEVDDFIH